MNCMAINILFQKLKNKFKKYRLVPQNEPNVENTENIKKKDITLDEKKVIIKDEMKILFQNRNFNNNMIIISPIKNIIDKYFTSIDCNNNQIIIKLICKKCHCTLYLYQHKCQVCENKYGDSLLNYYDYECKGISCRRESYFKNIKNKYRYHPNFIDHINDCILMRDENINFIYNIL
jgi:hypothetical protein